MDWAARGDELAILRGIMTRIFKPDLINSGRAAIGRLPRLTLWLALVCLFTRADTVFGSGIGWPDVQLLPTNARRFYRIEASQ